MTADSRTSSIWAASNRAAVSASPRVDGVAYEQPFVDGPFDEVHTLVCEGAHSMDLVPKGPQHAYEDLVLARFNNSFVEEAVGFAQAGDIALVAAVTTALGKPTQMGQFLLGSVLDC